MKNKNLKYLLILLVVIVIILVVILKKRVPSSSMDMKREEEVLTKTVDMNQIVQTENIDYNHLTGEQLSYFKEAYGEIAAFTERGIEIYMEKAFSGKPRKIITSEWPTAEIANVILKPDFGKIEKIEYADDYIHVYIQNASEGNLSSYMKKLKKEGYKESQKKEEGDVFVERYLSNEEGTNIKLRLYKKTKQLEINASK